MQRNIIDAHIHFDHYKENEQQMIVQSMDRWNIKGLITVSQDLPSAEKNLLLAKTYSGIYPAFGYHPEQSLPDETELAAFFDWIAEHEKEMVAIGEVGLPYYMRRDNKQIKLEKYIELLEQFILLAKRYDKPIILHAVYEDTSIVCDLLEKHSVRKAHFHWFKGDEKTVERMLENGYYISFTPDIVYEKEIQALAARYPLEQIMVETDGPWPFAGLFEGKLTEPKMIHESLKMIALIKKMKLQQVYHEIYENTLTFFKLKLK